MLDVSKNFGFAIEKGFLDFFDGAGEATQHNLLTAVFSAANLTAFGRTSCLVGVWCYLDSMSTINANVTSWRQNWYA